MVFSMKIQRKNSARCKKLFRFELALERRGRFVSDFRLARRLLTISNTRISTLCTGQTKNKR